MSTAEFTEGTAPPAAAASSSPGADAAAPSITPTSLTVSPQPQRPTTQSSTALLGLLSSRPASPASPSGSVGMPSHTVFRRPSSSMSASSRRAHLSPPDATLPQRLPRPAPADAAAFAQLHQELEAENEAQVNRLLNLIRQQSLASGGSIDGDMASNAATVDSTSTRAGRISRRGSNRLSRDGSYYRRSSVSRASSPALTAGGDSASESSAWMAAPHGTDFHIAESQMLKRENEMLKRRIRELEMIVAELSAAKTAADSSSCTAPEPPLAPVPADSHVSTPAA